MQLEQLGQQGFVKSQGPPTQLRVTGNEMQGLSSAGVLVLGDDEGSVLRDSRFGNVLGGPSIDRWYFLSVATIHLVTRCVVSGNMISNEEPLDASRKEIRRLSLVLDDGAIPSPAQTAPPARNPSGEQSLPGQNSD